MFVGKISHFDNIQLFSQSVSFHEKHKIYSLQTLRAIRYLCIAILCYYIANQICFSNICGTAMADVQYQRHQVCIVMCL